MGFSFKRGDRTALDGARRIAAEQLDAALKLLGAPQAPGAASVHKLRKHCKKTRGLLRLLYPVLKGVGGDNRRLRDAARHIAPLRDAEVRLGSFDLLARELPDLPGLAPLRRQLGAEVMALRADASMQEMLPAMAAELGAVRLRLEQWRPRASFAKAGKQEDGFALLRPGLEASWRGARAGLAAARAELQGDFDATPFHEWRKLAKHHWYQARLLAPIRPDMMAPHLAEADSLGELLGDHNDLDVLCTHLATHVAQAGDPPEMVQALTALRAAALRPRRLLAARAVGLGERLFAPPPRVLSALWGSWWAAWRR